MAINYDFDVETFVGGFCYNFFERDVRNVRAQLGIYEIMMLDYTDQVHTIKYDKMGYPYYYRYRGFNNDKNKITKYSNHYNENGQLITRIRKSNYDDAVIKYDYTYEENQLVHVKATNIEFVDKTAFFNSTFYYKDGLLRKIYTGFGHGGSDEVYYRYNDNGNTITIKSDDVTEMVVMESGRIKTYYFIEYVGGDDGCCAINGGGESYTFVYDKGVCKQMKMNDGEDVYLLKVKIKRY